MSRSHFCKSHSAFTLPSNIIRVWKWCVTWKMLGLSLISHMQTPASPRAPRLAVWVSLMWCSFPKQLPAKRNKAAPRACLGCSVWKRGVQKRTRGFSNVTRDVWLIHHCGQIQLDHPFTVADFLLPNHPPNYLAFLVYCYSFLLLPGSFYLLWACLEPVVMTVMTAERDQHSFLDITFLMSVLVLPSWQAWLHALLKCGTTKYFPLWFTSSRIDVTQVFQPL